MADVEVRKLSVPVSPPCVSNGFVRSLRRVLGVDVAPTRMGDDSGNV